MRATLGRTMARVEFFFDYTCPYAYLASTQIEALCARTGSELVWRPMLLGGLFRSLGVATNLAATLHPLKAKMLLADQRRWADLWGVSLGVPRPGGYARSVDALRATLVADEAERARVIHALFRAHWVDHRDIGDPTVLCAVLDEAGVSGAALLGRVDEAAKRALRENTEEAASRGAFGAPAIFVGDELYFGQDRLVMLELSLGGAANEPGEGRFHRDGPAPDIEFFYDVASPFSYLGAVGVTRAAARLGAKVLFRPILLGGLFKLLGGPNAPFETYSANKQRFVGVDLARWAHRWNVDFRWSSRFPVRTLKAQRVATALLPESDAGGFDAVERFSMSAFQAIWSRDADPDDDAVLGECLVECGLDPALVQRASDPLVKQALAENTQRAMEAGVFGAPSFRVRGALFWGQDRVCLVERAVEGWVPPAMD
jgi:2-hydroxychromene-2-carboxylate isomerase